MREEVKLKDTKSMNKTMAFLIRQDVTNESLLQHYISFYLEFSHFDVKAARSSRGSREYFLSGCLFLKLFVSEAIFPNLMTLAQHPTIVSQDMSFLYNGYLFLVSTVLRRGKFKTLITAKGFILVSLSPFCRTYSSVPNKLGGRLFILRKKNPPT